MHDWRSPNRTYTDDNARGLRKGDRLVSLHGISGARITDEPFVFEEDVFYGRGGRDLPQPGQRPVRHGGRRVLDPAGRHVRTDRHHRSRGDLTMERHIEAMADLNQVISDIKVVTEELRRLYEMQRDCEQAIYKIQETEGRLAHINTDGQWAWDEDGWR